MGATSITLKVNSYRTKNTVLENGDIIHGSNKTQNVKSKSILSCADDFFDAIRAELNERYELTVFGNAFEQAYIAAEAARRGAVIGCTGKSHRISWSSCERLRYLLGIMGNDIAEKVIPLSIAGDCRVMFPSYPRLRFVSSPQAQTLVVSHDIEDIKESWRDGNCATVAFLVGGESQRDEGSELHIIGCTEDNVQDLVQSYLETKYVNPYVGELFALLDAITEPRTYLVDKIEPHFYVDDDSRELSLFEGDKYTLGIHSVSMDADGNIVLDADEDLHRLTICSWTDGVPDNQNSLVASFAAHDRRKISARKEGLRVLSYFFEDTDKLFDVFITVIPHVYAQSIKLEICHRGTPVKRWRVGQWYDIESTIKPANAEDIDQLVYSTDNRSVARVEGKQIVILRNGAFSLKATGVQVSNERYYIIDDAVVESIAPSVWAPDNSILAKKGFVTEVDIEPKSANWQGFSCEVTEGADHVSVQVIGKNRVRISAVKPGSCTIRFTSKDNPKASCTKELHVVRPKKMPRPRKHSNISTVLFFVALVALAIDTRFTFLLGAAAAFFGAIGLLRRERLALLSFILPLLLLGAVYISTLAPAESWVPSHSIDAIVSQSEEDILSSRYDEHNFSGNVSWTPIDTEYIGHFACKPNVGSEFFACFVFETTLVSPSSDKPKDMYSVITYKGTAVLNYRFINTTPYDKTSWCTTFDFVLRTVEENGDVVQSSFTDDELYVLRGLNAYVDSVSDITSSDIDWLVANCASYAGLDIETVSYEAAYLYISDDVYSEHRNHIVVVLKKDAGDGMTYYFPFKLENVMMEEDENGILVMNRDDIDIEDGEYVLSMDELTSEWDDSLIALEYSPTT